jgi:DNA (cytosine-5)-methyltransferase 1
VLLEDEAEGDDSVDDDASSADSEPTVPVRRLTDFALFECRTGYLINATELLEPSLPPGVYGASGAVQTVDEEEDDDEYEDNSHVRLLNILELSIHHLEDDTLDEQVLPFHLGYSLLTLTDRRIYIRTALAWYILDTPSTAYRPFYTPLNIRHRLTHVLLTKAMRKPRITYQEFIEHLDDLDDSITESDLKSDDVVSSTKLSFLRY